MVLSETGELQEGEKHQGRVCGAAWDKFREGYPGYNEPFKYVKHLLSRVCNLESQHILKTRHKLFKQPE